MFGTKLIKRNSLIYEMLIHKLIQDSTISVEDKVSFAETIAEFAWRNPPGFYADGRLENLLVNIGKSIPNNQRMKPFDSLPSKFYQTGYSEKILVIVSEVAGVGGHTRLIERFIMRNDQAFHYVIVTSQRREVLPQFWLKRCKPGSFFVATLETMQEYLQKASYLRALSREFDRIIIFTHPQDSLPLLAFAIPDVPPIIVNDHAHYNFWLGTAIADVVWHCQEPMVDFSRKYRGIKKGLWIPVGEDSVSRGRFDKSKAKEKLGFPKNEILLLSVGTVNKYIPTKRYNFFSTASRLLETYLNVNLCVIGVPPTNKWVKRYFSHSSHRVRFLPPMPELHAYYQAADIFLDPFPISSGGALREAALWGDVCPFSGCASKGSLLSHNSASQLSCSRFISSSTQEEYVKKIGRLIGDRCLRLKIVEELCTTNKQQHSMFADKLNELYAMLPGKHAVRTLKEQAIPCDHPDRLIISAASQHQKLDEVFKFLRKGMIKHTERYILIELLAHFGSTYECLKLIIRRTISQLLAGK